MENETYLADVGITPSHKNYARCLRALEDYGENRWWLSDNLQRRAYYQTEEMIKTGLLLLPSLESYQLDLYALLNRPVASIELAEAGLKGLLAEVREAWLDLLIVQGRESEAEEVRQRFLQETVYPMLEDVEEKMRKRGGIFLMPEDARKNLFRLPPKGNR